MSLLAIDASTRSTGIAFFEKNKLVYYDCIIDSGKDVLSRIEYMTKEIQKIFLKYKPDKVIMQQVLPQEVGHNQNVYKSLMYLQAKIVLMFHEYKKNVKLVVASHWRKQCGFKTGSSVTRDRLKQQSQNLVKGIYGIESNDDISDAICLGLAEIIENGYKE